LNSRLASLAAKAGLDWLTISAEAVEVVVFGSRAVGINTRASDLDVLVVGTSNGRIKRSGLDLVAVSTQRRESSEWLKSELAGHISRYGVWILGSGDWRSQAVSGAEAVIRKERRLTSLVKSVSLLWARLHPTLQSKYSLTIRREFQRLGLLRQSTPIPPTRILDSWWSLGSCVDLPLLANTIPLSVNGLEFLESNVWHPKGDRVRRKKPAKSEVLDITFQSESQEIERGGSADTWAPSTRLD
jgi:predicted nucleotidyltransferase